MLTTVKSFLASKLFWFEMHYRRFIAKTTLATFFFFKEDFNLLLAARWASNRRRYLNFQGVEAPH